MKLSFIKNKFNDILAVQVFDYSFDTEDVEEIISLIRKYGIVIWRRTDLSLQDYNTWQLKLGYHQHADIWCSHKDYPIFFRVTNKRLREGQKGLFEDKELDWHCNILFTPDSEELLGLYAKTIPKGSKTFFANSLPYYKNLSDSLREELGSLWIEVTGKIEDTYEKTLAHHQLEKYQSDDFDKKRADRDLRKSVNFEKRHFNLYKKPRCLKHSFLKMIPNHPLGAKGVYFPHLNIASVTNSTGQPVSNHREIYETVKKDYILSGRYVYHHEWKPGDIVLADQLTGVHKRNNIWKQSKDAERELLRSACWYKTSFRQHFERAI